MSYLAVPSTMASGGTMSAQADLGRVFQNVYLEIPTLTSSSNGMYIYGSNKLSGTYRILMAPSVNSATVATNTYIIATAASNCMVPIPSGFRFLKVNTDATVDDGCVFNFICGGSTN